MTMFGLKEAEIAELVRAVSASQLDNTPHDRAAAGPQAPERTAPENAEPGPDDLQSAEVEERFARASWSGIAEPGDRVAGQLIDALGAARALSVLIDGHSADRILGEAGSRAAFSGDDLHVALGRWQPRLSSATTLTALRQAARLGVRLSIPGDEYWIESVGDLGESAPIALWQRGRPETISALSRSIALVGARAATGYGEHVTMEASAGLVDRGFAIVSGAAYGIDGVAHRAALASHGQTVAFLAGGVDRFYPAGHDALLGRIVEQGCVISELPCGAQPSKWRFLQRNRLIAASSQATVVLEAGWRSGALNTVNHALTMGRPVGAVPGPVTSAASAGCHRAIRDFDVMLVNNADEMAQLLDGVSGQDSTERVEPREDPRHVRLLDALSDRAARTPTEIATRSGMSLLDVQAALAALELHGRVREREGGWVKVVSRQPR